AALLAVPLLVRSRHYPPDIHDSRTDRRRPVRRRAAGRVARGGCSTHRPRSSTSAVPLLTHQHPLRTWWSDRVFAHTGEETQHETHVVRAAACGGVLRRPGSQPATDAAPDGFAGGAGPAAARQAGQLTSRIGPAACGTRSGGAGG